MLKKILAALLALTSVAALAACASETSGTSDTSDTTPSADTTAAESKELTDSEKLANAVASLPDVDYDGYTFKVFTRESSTWGTEDVYAESQNGEPINDAVYERNSIIEEKFDVKITEVRYEAEEGIAQAANLVLSNEDSFDTITHGLARITKQLAIPGYLVDLTTINEINFDADHWDPMVEEGLSIGGKLYFGTGDISIMDNKGTWCMLFNKKMVTDYSLDDPYELVDGGAWTIDRVHEMASAASVDLDGDGVMADYDQWGYLTEDFNTYALWAGSGEKVTTKDADDLPVLSLYNERSVNVMDKVYALQADHSCSITGEKHKDSWDGVTASFSGGKALFYQGGMRLISLLRDSDVDFGILPNPKFEESQEDYFNSYSFTNFTAFSVPITASNLSRTGNILEAMAAISKYTLTPAYYDITLEGKFLRDEESSAMIDIILATRSFDLGAIFNWGNSFSMILGLGNKQSNDFASAYAALEDKTIAAIDEFIATLAD